MTVRRHLLNTVLAPHATTALARALRPLIVMLTDPINAPPAECYPCPFCHQLLTDPTTHAQRYRDTPHTVACDPPEPGQAKILTPRASSHVVH